MQIDLVRKAAAGVLAALTLATTCPNLPALAQSADGRIAVTDTTGSDVDGITRQILNKEIEFARMTADYRLHNVPYTAFRKWYTAILSTAAYSVADAGNIVTFRNGFKYHTHPQDFTQGRSEVGPCLIMIGEMLFFARTSGIMFTDIIHNEMIKRKGYDRKTYQTKALALNTEIRSLLTRRKGMISSADSAASQEQAVLTDVADSLTREYITNYARATRIAVSHIGENIVSNYASATGAFIGGLGVYNTAKHSRPKQLSTAGIGFLLQGPGFIIKDPAAYFGGRIAEHNTTQKLLAQHPELQSDPVTQLDADKQRLATLNVSGQIVGDRNKAYDLMSQALKKDQIVQANENKRLLHRYYHDQFINALEGGAVIGAGAIFAKAGYKFHYTPYNPLNTLFTARLFLKRFAIGALVFTPTASGGMIDTPVEALYDTYRHKKDNEEGIGPEAGMKARLALLDQAAGAIK
ncbi:MAG: hypothetical protein JSS86_02890 [Cyanobacteria bacterium SZAS LIN-2]|nr:hypothetical protein [Cyanobacteria bacterium SZAS LIN-2]